jgi:hypothetical protein
MAVATCWAILGMGAFFTIFGVVALLLGRRERSRYYDSILKGKDIKEYITHEPQRSWLGAWVLGGKISMVLGLLLLGAAGVILLVVW